MAGDWIKMRVELPDDPDVIAIAAATGIEEDTAVGKLLRFWGWISSHTTDGNAPGVTPAWLDRYLGAPGFAEALASVGWLEITDDGLSVPDFERYLSEGAKARALTAQRVARHKANKSRKGNAGGNGGGVTKTLPREEKRREESSCATHKKPPLSPVDQKAKRDPIRDPDLPESLDTDAFRAAWAAWVRHRSEIRKPLKPTQVAAQLRKLGEWGEARAVAAIEHTIEKGWQGLREPEPDGVGRSPPDRPARSFVDFRKFKPPEDDA